MLLKERINLKRYFLWSFSSTILFVFLFSRSLTLNLVILGFYIATLANHYLLFKMVSGILEGGKGKKSLGKDHKKMARMSFFLISKVLVLGAAVIIGFMYVGDRIIVPTLNYVVQIFILALSLKRT